MGNEYGWGGKRTTLETDRPRQSLPREKIEGETHRTFELSLFTQRFIHSFT